MFPGSGAQAESGFIEMQQEETKKLRRIRQISVTNLFGIFNHTIPLNMADRITIIHGPNGFGKTVMLKLLHALFSQRNLLLQTIPFDEFRVDFEDSTSFWVSKVIQLSEPTEEEHTGEREIVFYATRNLLHPLRWKLPTRAELSTVQLSTIEHHIPSLMRVGPETWHDNRTGTYLYLEEVIDQFADRLPTELTGERTKMPEWLVELRKSISIRFIETQRLLSSSRSLKRNAYDRILQTEYAVITDSRHLVDMIGKKLAESARLSQSLDRTFPARLISPATQHLQVAEDELLSKLKKLEERRSQLMATGLLDKETGAVFPVGSNQEISSNTKAVLAVYVEDTEKKLGIFDELFEKINLLTTIINNRFLYKTMTIDKEKGFVFTSKKGDILPLEDLSSGEQHELVLFYELLFRITPGSLVLIDEPELSLHVVWQEHFLQDIQQVTKLTNTDVILATHSPDIISNRRDLVVELEEPKNGRLQ